MADIATRGAELKKLLKLCKQRDVAFAYCPGGNTEEDVFCLHRKKKPEIIGREARAESVGTKIAFGTASVSGKVLSLTCERQLPGLAKKLKKLLKFEKCPLNVVILDQNGNVLEEDIEDLPDSDLFDDSDDGGASDAPNDDPDESLDDGRIKRLKQRAAVLQAAIKDAPPQVQPKLIVVFKGAVSALQSNDLNTAETTLDKLEQVVGRIDASASPSPSDVASDSDVPTDMSPYANARAGWMRARAGLQAEMTKLEKAIRAVCQGAQFENVDIQTQHLFTYLEPLDDRLDMALEAIIAETENTQRDALLDKARSILSQYQSELDKPFFKDVDSKNGFVSVSIREAATSALAEVDAVLSRSAA